MNGWQKSVMASPMSFVPPVFMARADTLTRYPRRSMASWTRWRVSGRILPVLFSTFDTVLMETPVSRATSVMVTRFATAPLSSHHRACSARFRRNARLIPA